MPKQPQNIPSAYKKQQKALAKDIGLRIRKRRLEMQLSQIALREKFQLEGVYLSRSRHSRIEHGEQLPLASEVIAFSRALRVSLDWLLLGTR